MAAQREKPALKNKSHLDKAQQDNAASKGKKPELLVFDFSDDAAVGKPSQDDEQELGSSPRKKEEKTSPRDAGRKGADDDDGDKISPRGPAAADDRSPRSDPGSPRKGENQPKVDTDAGDKTGRPGRNRSPDKTNAGGKPKPSDASPRPPARPERPHRNTFTGKSTLSL